MNKEKFVKAGRIVSESLNELIEFIEPSQKLNDLCKKGDEILNNKLNSISEKGLICFPTCVCKNEYAGYLRYSNDEVKEGDLIKIEMGCCVDNCPSLINYSYIVNKCIDSKMKPLMEALSKASKKSLELIKPSKKNTNFVKEINNIGKSKDVNLLNGEFNDTKYHVPSQISYEIDEDHAFRCKDDKKLLILRESSKYDFYMMSDEFLEDEIYYIDIGFSTGTGKLNESEYTPTIYLRNIDLKKGLKTNSSKKILLKFDNETSFPKDLGDKVDVRTKLGIKECFEKDLLEEFKIMKEKKGEYIGRIGFTIMLNENKNILLSAKSLDPELEKL